MKRSGSLVILTVCLIASASITHANPPALVDCTKWQETESRPMIIDAYNNIQTIADDLWYAKYSNPDGSTCTRFFLKSNNQTIWQNWKDSVGKTYAYLIPSDNTPYTASGSVVKWRMNSINLFTGRGRIELGFFEGDKLTKSRFLDLSIHNEQLPQ